MFYIVLLYRTSFEMNIGAQRPRSAQSVQRLSTGWTVRGSNPGGGRDFPHASRPALGSTQPPVQSVPGVSFLGVKRSGRGVDHPPPSSAEVKERVELYLYSPSGPSWTFLGVSFTFNLPLRVIPGFKNNCVTSRNYVKDKGQLITFHRGHRGGKEVWLYSFLTLAL